ncbi:hypothetical protein D3C87_1392080 [compost metagenome]
MCCCFSRFQPVVELDGLDVHVVSIDLTEVLDGHFSTGARYVADGTSQVFRRSHVRELLHASGTVNPEHHFGVGVGHGDVTRQTQRGHCVSLHDRHGAVAVFHHAGVLDGTTSVDDFQLGTDLLGDVTADTLTQRFVRTTHTTGAEGQLSRGRNSNSGSQSESQANNQLLHSFTPNGFIGFVTRREECRERDTSSCISQSGERGCSCDADPDVHNAEPLPPLS